MNAGPKKAETEAGATNEMKGIWVALWVIVWFAAILVAFFFIGAVVGVAAVIAGAVISLLVGFRFIKRESTETG
jgi:Flp pilus assembly protein TadB